MANLISNGFLENTIYDRGLVAQNFLTTFVFMKDGEPIEKGCLVVNGA